MPRPSHYFYLPTPHRRLNPLSILSNNSISSSLRSRRLLSPRSLSGEAHDESDHDDDHHRRHHHHHHHGHGHGHGGEGEGEGEGEGKLNRAQEGILQFARAVGKLNRAQVGSIKLGKRKVGRKKCCIKLFHLDSTRIYGLQH